MMINEDLKNVIKELLYITDEHDLKVCLYSLLQKQIFMREKLTEKQKNELKKAFNIIAKHLDGLDK